MILELFQSLSVSVFFYYLYGSATFWRLPWIEACPETYGVWCFEASWNKRSDRRLGLVVCLLFGGVMNDFLPVDLNDLLCFSRSAMVDNIR